jgi:hypothetical protein
VQLDRQADHLVAAAGDRGQVESLDDPDAGLEQDLVDFGPVGVVPAHRQVIDPDGAHLRLGQVQGGLLRQGHEVLDEVVGLPAPGRVHGAEQHALAGLQVVPAQLVRGDLTEIFDLDHPGLAHRRGQRHLVQTARAVDEVHRRVHVRAAVYPHG